MLLLLLLLRLLLLIIIIITRSSEHAAPFISLRSAVIGAFRSCHCSIVLASSCFLSGPLLYCFSVVVLFDLGYSSFRNFNCTIPADVIRVKTYVDSFLNPTCVPLRISINKHDLTPNR